MQTSIFSDNQFYRTTPLRDEIKAESAARSQQDKILRYMKETGKEVTAWSLKDVFPDYEITSIRRSLFNLEMKDCSIVRTGWVVERKGREVGKYKAM
jgi:hypothetical protein